MINVIVKIEYELNFNFYLFESCYLVKSVFDLLIFCNKKLVFILEKSSLFLGVVIGVVIVCIVVGLLFGVLVVYVVFRRVVFVRMGFFF